MNYTSGTTGRPRGIRRPLPGKPPEEAYLGGFLGIFGIRPFDDNVHLVCSPLYHTAVLQFAGASLHIGHRLVLMDKWTPEEMLRLIDRHRCTHTHMVPTQFHRLLALPDEVKDRYDVSSMRHAIHGAAPCPDHVKRAMLDWWGPVCGGVLRGQRGRRRLRHRRGLAEETRHRRQGLAHQRTRDLRRRRQPAAARRTRHRLHEDEHGRLLVPQGRGQDPQEPHRRLLHRRRPRPPRRGRLPLPARPQDRPDHLRRRQHLPGRDRVGPARHPAVADAAVFGIPHADWGEEVKAVVEPAPGHRPGPALAADLLDHCAHRLAGYKRPRSVDFITEMPRDPNGKLYKRRLREPYWEGRTRPV
ncbi:hypothetical protein STAFG_8132 [Streptomyces afghaniensis 772]|uniref:Long-chain-fatty-acid--CoA ligase n=1 Tax=Streptomyces afghaniensis 772 TaxID=1283301 RepID=S4M6J8_9ACTN|nr:hypothetical protein STAFG_8132 [Streptomyces afghaniensis 772]